MPPERIERMKIAGGATLVALLMLPMWFEMREPGQPVWNVILLGLLSGIVGGSAVLLRFFLRNADKMGEARFDTRNKE